MDMRLQEVIIYTHPIEGLWEQYRGERKGHEFKIFEVKIWCSYLGYVCVERRGDLTKNSLPVFHFIGSTQKKVKFTLQYMSVTYLYM